MPASSGPAPCGALPRYANEVVGLMHAPSIASTVNLVELTRVPRDVGANHLMPVEAFGTVVVFCFARTSVLAGVFIRAASACGVSSPTP